VKKKITLLLYIKYLIIMTLKTLVSSAFYFLLINKN